MDILAEKTHFTLTDKIIPGHFGHTAIWLGNRHQLEKYGLWQQKFMKIFQKDIEKGLCILETDRKGTHLKSLKDFLNIDELAVIRIKNFKNTTINNKIITYQHALAQLGKKYDFTL